MHEEDPDQAQARIFLADLERHARVLLQRRAQLHTAAVDPALDTELRQIQRQIRNIRHRFPSLAPPGN
ncbi:hypothetical protein ACWDOP_03285 [Nocardia sp. NPDC003693]